MSGWIKIYKQFKDWEWYKKSEMVHLFIHCLLKANYKDGSFQGMEVEKGSFITSLKHLSDETNISVQTIRTCLKKLENTKEINIQSTNKLTKITVCKYDSYQVDEVKTNKQLTNKQQTTNKQLTTIEEYKEYKEDIYRQFAHLKLSDSEFEQLRKIGYPKNQIDSVLDSIENYKKNNKYKSLFLTTKNWLQKEGVQEEKQYSDPYVEHVAKQLEKINKQL